MPQFTYIGKSTEGQSVTETVEAVDRFAVYDVARKNGHTVTTVTEVRGGFSMGGQLFDKLNALISTVKQDEIVMFTRNLSAMLKAGLPMSRALSVGERQTRNAKMKFSLHTIGERLNQGTPLNDALADFPKIFSRLYVMMVRAGEESGTLADALSILALQMERSSTLKKKIKGAMIYPAIVVAVMIMIGILMMIYVVPTLTATFKELNANLPLSTQAIMVTSDFLSQHPLLAFGSMAGAVFACISLLRTRFGKRGLDWTVTRLPIIGKLAKETNAARTARTLSSLLASGVDVVSSITITKDVLQNSYYKEILADAAVRVEKGSPLSGVFIENEKLYPILVGEMISVGEETGQISEMLLQVAIFYENEVEQKTKDLSTIIEPLLMVVIGGMVGFFALAMIAPIYSISDSIN